MTNTNWRNATQREDKKDWQELARVTRLVQPENNALNRKKLDQWLTKAITKNKSLSSDASRSRNTNDFWFHKGKIEALAELRLELRESTYVLESEKKAQKEEAPTWTAKT